MALNLVVLVVALSCLAHSSYSYQFVAGGRDGWVLKPSEPYLHWASRMRFQVNDTILFKYKSGSDSVLVVNKDAYDKCDVANAILKLDDGNSVFKFDRSGPFYFISGNKPSCDQGQKLITVVLAVRSPPSPPSPTAAPPQGSSPAPSPTAAPPQGSSPAPSPTAAPPQGSSPAPSPAAGGGAPAPAASPSSTSPAPAESGPSPAGGSSEPPSSSSMPPGSSIAGGPGGSSTPGSGTPADANSRPAPPRSMASPPCSNSMLLMSVVLSVGFGMVIVSP